MAVTTPNTQGGTSSETITVQPQPEQQVLTKESETQDAEHKAFGIRGALASLSIILCQFVQMIPYGCGITGSANMAAQLGVPPDNAVWIVASYPLTQGTFVLIGGRVGAIYGHKNTIIVAGTFWVVTHLISGFMRNIISLCVFRALSGIGGAFIVPNAIALLTITFPPGKIRNISVGLFGAMAPIGASLGSLFPGLFGQLAPWWWLFFALAILGTPVFILFFFVVPSEGKPMDPDGKFDYIGAYLGVAGLILFNFVWTQSSLVGWAKPYVYALLIVSLLHFALFAVWEAKYAAEPVLPFTIWTAPSFGPMIASAFLTFMGVGMVIWYTAAWNLNIRGYSIFLASASFVPLTMFGAIAAVLSAVAVRYIAAEYLMAIGSLASCAALILIATMPEQQIYWAQVFPAILIVSLGPDFVFTAAQIIASVTVKRKQQGIAGSLIGTILSYGLSTGLGFSGTVEFYTNKGGDDLVHGYRSGLYTGIGMTALSAGIALLFVRIPRDRREGWGENDGQTREVNASG